MTPFQKQSVVAVRIIGIAMIAFGLVQVIANLIDGWYEFDPTYLGYFLKSQLLRPGLLMGVGGLLFWLSPRFGKWIGSGLD